MRKYFFLILLLLSAVSVHGQTVQCQTPSGAWGPCPLNASVQLFSAQSATGTATATAQKVYNFSMSGNLIATYASITGSPSACTFQVKSGDSLGNLINNGSAVSTTPANGTTSTTFVPATSQQTADQISVVFACSVYPTTGTLSLEFVPSTISMPLDSSGNLKVNISSQSLSKVLVTPDALPANQSINESQINGATPLMGNGVSGTGSQRVNVASDNTPFETIPTATATTTDTTLRCTLVSAASTNATNCKASAGNVYGFRFVNTTQTVYYLRMYNLTTSPTCSSATGFIESIPIPPGSSATTSGGIVAMEPFGEGYSTGIGFCFTGGSSSTDNTNAATGVFGSILYK